MVAGVAEDGVVLGLVLVVDDEPDLVELVHPGDVMVFNDTKVIPARLRGRRVREEGAGADVEVTLIGRLDEARWRALARPAKRLKSGDLVRFGGNGNVCFLDMLDATVESMLTTTPFLSPDDAWAPLPMTVTAPSRETSPISVTTLLVPTSSATRIASRSTTPFSPKRTALASATCAVPA